ncbi:HlyD family type I secretion periplasmic adaptor subunit [Rhizobium etli]|uniref:HlyD family type I secretion periplasmic adaptor subunit n=1 Tax=Rhizobium etli TaxID=29449 RepID=UPI0003839136|nr:HlyD family type I secretion periplasmic adaptor subunit [Rhizobium etli]AGS20616.1 HlyD family type I secretion membrane fusion protein [Rhizobium etli bv. mimosae str. Mim1]
MNQNVQPPRLPPKPQKRSQVDNEFLPAALEILETPASPIRTALIWFICLFTMGALIWSYVGTFDIVATAQGKIQPTGRVKVIQSIEVGKTIAVPVSNGIKVEAGDVLVELDPTEARAEVAALTASVSALRAEVTRRGAALAQVEAWQRTDLWSSTRKIEIAPEFDASIPADVRRRETLLYNSDLEQLASTLDSLAAQRNQQVAAVKRYSEMVAAQQALVATLADRVAMRSNLVDLSAGSRSGVIDAVEIKQKEEANLAEQIGQRAEAEMAIVAATSDGLKILKTFVADNAQKQAQALREIDEREQQLVKAAKRLDSMTIKSPIRGIVQTSAITTVGQVVTSGAELMRIVPDDSSLEIEAYLPNRDIGFVSPGQHAVIKVEAFPFTRYGILNGTVTRIATDAIPEPDAQQLEGQPAKELQSVIPIGNAQRVQNLVFPIVIKLDETSINIDGTGVALSPGMSVTVEVKTGNRRILEYLYAPLAEISSEAMQER